MISQARAVAYAVLERVEGGSWASDLLLAHSEGIEPRDASLAHEIVFGCLRRQAQLDYLIEQLTHRPVSRLDIAVRVALRMGAYQLRHLDRVPAYAAVGESVELVRKARKASAVGLVNAVLRRIPRDEVQWPTSGIALSMPEWLLTQWERQFGRDVSRRIAGAFLARPETYVRNPPMDQAGLSVEPTDVPGAWRVKSGDLDGLRVQDIGSQAIVPLLHLQPGMTFLDLCAAPGNKTSQALESGVKAIACDRHAHRLRNVSGCPRVVLDATRPLPFRGKFDRILIDAPCSGTGTLGRNPEIRWRITPADIEQLHERQTTILRYGLEHLASGGRLAYSTCSLEQRENEDVVAGVDGARLLETRRRIPGVDEGDGFFVAVFTID